MPKPEKHVFVCLQSRPPGHPKGSCAERHKGELIAEFSRQYEEHELFGRMGLTSTGCLGPCDMGPTVLVYPEGVMYVGVTTKDVEEIVEQHLVGDQPVERLKVSPEIWG